MFGICNHQYGEVKNEFQYCSKCGIARRLPCSHTYEIMQQVRVLEYDRFYKHLTIISRCTKCGNIKKDICE